MGNARYEQHRIAFEKGELPPPTVPLPNNAVREARIASQQQRRAESQQRREEAIKARQEARTGKSPIVKTTLESCQCSLRGEAAGEVDCGCSGKPLAYVCNHTATDNWNPENRIPNRRIPGCGFCTLNVVSVRHKRIIKSDGTDIPLTHLSLPACSMCDERAKYSEQPQETNPVETVVQEVQTFDPFPEADNLVVQTRKAICSVCQLQAECPMYQSKALTMRLSLCPAGYWTTRTSLMPELPFAQTVLGFFPVHSQSGFTTQTNTAPLTCGTEKYQSRSRIGWLNVASDVDIAEVEA